ncbi:MAG: hypothetical protein ABI167_10365 [Nitrosospira sp.]
MSAFKVIPKKKPVDPNVLAAFSAGAEAHQSIAVPIIEPLKTQERQTESLLFRLTKSDLDEFNFVFENTNVKSKQKLLEAIILEEIHHRAMAIKKAV